MNMRMLLLMMMMMMMIMSSYHGNLYHQNKLFKWDMGFSGAFIETIVGIYTLGMGWSVTHDVMWPQSYINFITSDYIIRLHYAINHTYMES